MPGIFISYRREESIDYAGRLYDWISNHFGQDNAFIDVDTIEPGEGFFDVVEENVRACDALVALIGKNWLNCQDEEGTRRLDNPDDLVRLEIMAALNGNVPIIPVLLEGAIMPRMQELPEPLNGLVKRQAFALCHTSFQRDVARLVETLEKALVTGANRRKKESARTELLAAENVGLERLAHEDVEEPVGMSGRFASHRRRSRFALMGGVLGLAVVGGSLLWHPNLQRGAKTVPPPDETTAVQPLNSAPQPAGANNAKPNSSEPSRRIQVGGNVQSAKLVLQPKPVYPPLAKQAHIQGVVSLKAVIDKDGTIQNLTLVSGHPLLVPAAMAAVKQWVYQPTLLDGEPVEVATHIDVNFTLSQ